MSAGARVTRAKPSTEKAPAEAARVVRPRGRLGLGGLELARIGPDTAGRTLDDKEDDSWEITGVSPDAVGGERSVVRNRSPPRDCAHAWRPHSAYITMAAEEREQRLDEAARIVAAEATRRATATVPFGHKAHCARVRP
jgi:hypothetical protein